VRLSKEDLKSAVNGDSPVAAITRYGQKLYLYDIFINIIAR
jgi:hypothetical protein